ncbi:MAG TPA: hypothetical protein VGE60_00675 [Telluria sp.]
MSEQLIGLTNVDPAALSEHTLQLLLLRDEVIAQWKEKVAQTVPRAAGLGEPILENTLPVLFDGIALLLTPAYLQRAGVDISVVAIEHGGERAPDRLRHYQRDPRASDPAQRAAGDC